MVSITELIQKTICKEVAAIEEIIGQIDENYEKAIHLILNCKGKIVLTGIGKSGHIGKKIAATFASTGTPAFFMHSAEGLHGDLGMIQNEDIVILLSNSGETTELLDMVPSLKQVGVKMILITSNKYSTLANYCDVVIAYRFKGEVDHLGLAPTASSTIALVIGDALALTLSFKKNFTKESFHLFHPGGNLGKKLRLERK